MEHDQRRDQDWTPTWLERVRRRVRRSYTRVREPPGSWRFPEAAARCVHFALHRLAAELGLTLSVAHLDHGTRGEAARADAALHALAGSLGLPLDLGQWRPTRAGHFEADARRAGYSWLLEIAAAQGASAVRSDARDDQAERSCTGSSAVPGCGASAGMPPQHSFEPGSACRPCRPPVALGLTAGDPHKPGIAGTGFWEECRRRRPGADQARIRHDLLPRLAQEYNPRVAEAILRLGMLAGACEQATMERDVIELEHDATRLLSHDQVELRSNRLLQSPLFLRAEVLRRVWRLAGSPEAGMSARRWRRLA